MWFALPLHVLIATVARKSTSKKQSHTPIGNQNHRLIYSREIGYKNIDRRKEEWAEVKPSTSKKPYPTADHLLRPIRKGLPK